MTKIIYNKFDKKQIGQLPRVLFGGKIVVVLTVSEADKAVKYLLSRDILGIDTETRPVFRKGQHHKVALLQVLRPRHLLSLPSQPHRHAEVGTETP